MGIYQLEPNHTVHTICKEGTKVPGNTIRLRVYDEKDGLFRNCCKDDILALDVVEAGTVMGRTQYIITNVQRAADVGWDAVTMASTATKGPMHHITLTIRRSTREELQLF